MKRFIGEIFLIVTLTVILTACGGDDGGVIVEVDGAVLFGANCVPCHATDAADVEGTTIEAITTAMIDPATGMAPVQGTFTDEELSALADFLATGGHAEGWRSSRNHGEFAEENGVENCRLCHGGPELTGTGTVPSCFSCHGKEW